MITAEKTSTIGKKILIIVLILIGLSAGFLYWQYNKLMNYTYKIKKFKILNFTKDRINLTMQLSLLNTSIFTINITDYNFKIYINDKHVGEVISGTPFVLNSNAETLVPINLDINPKKSFSLSEIIQLVSYYVSDKSKIIFNFKGNAIVKKFGLQISIPLDLPYTLKELLEDEEIEN